MRPPDIEGSGVRAWRARKLDEPATGGCSASIAQWFVNCTWAHPAWNWWMVAVVHLRPVEGTPPANLHYPGAEYEFQIVSLDPREPPPDADHPERGFRYLEPLDVIYQFHGVSDHDAERICEAAVRAIAEGMISPDQDYRARWKFMLDRTVAHFKSGAHVEH